MNTNELKSRQCGKLNVNVFYSYIVCILMWLYLYKYCYYRKILLYWNIVTKRSVCDVEGIAYFTVLYINAVYTVLMWLLITYTFTLVFIENRVWLLSQKNQWTWTKQRNNKYRQRWTQHKKRTQILKLKK